MIQGKVFKVDSSEIASLFNDLDFDFDLPTAVEVAQESRHKNTPTHPVAETSATHFVDESVEEIPTPTHNKPHTSQITPYARKMNNKVDFDKRKPQKFEKYKVRLRTLSFQPITLLIIFTRLFFPRHFFSNVHENYKPQQQIQKNSYR